MSSQYVDHAIFRSCPHLLLQLLRDVQQQSQHQGVCVEFTTYVNGRRMFNSLYLYATNSWIPGTMEAATFAQLQAKLSRGVDDLEKYNKYITKFATWWIWTKMDTSTQCDRTEMIVFNYNSLREKSVIDMWKVLQREFADYNDQV